MQTGHQELVKLSERLTKKRWLILFACCLCNMSIGSMYAWSVFAVPMASHLSIIRDTTIIAADLASVFSISNATAMITVLLGGALEQRMGCRKIISVGTIAYGLGFVFCGFAQNVPMLMFGYGVIGGMASGFGYSGIISLSVRLFPDKKGLAGGLSTASFGGSAVIMPLIVDMLIKSYGIDTIFVILGVVFAIIGVACFIIILDCPSGFQPAGWTPKKVQVVRQTKDYTMKEMLRTPQCYMMLLIWCLGAFPGLMLISSATDVAQTLIKMKPTQAAIIVSLLAVFNTLSRIVSGALSDLFGRVQTICLSFILTTGALMVLYFGQGLLTFGLGICLLGFCYGTLMGVFPGFVSDEFGVKYNGMNYAVMFTGFSLAGIVAPLVMSAVYVRAGSYRETFLVASMFAIMAMIISLIFMVVKRRAAAKS